MYGPKGDCNSRKCSCDKERGHTPKAVVATKVNAGYALLMMQTKITCKRQRTELIIMITNQITLLGLTTAMIVIVI